MQKTRDAHIGRAYAVPSRPTVTWWTGSSGTPTGTDRQSGRRATVHASPPRRAAHRDSLLDGTSPRGRGEEARRFFIRSKLGETAGQALQRPKASSRVTGRAQRPDEVTLRKSGHRDLAEVEPLCADCHIRSPSAAASPEVRMIRSGSGWPLGTGARRYGRCPASRPASEIGVPRRASSASRERTASRRLVPPRRGDGDVDQASRPGRRCPVGRLEPCGPTLRQQVQRDHGCTRQRRVAAGPSNLLDHRQQRLELIGPLRAKLRWTAPTG